MYSNSKMMMLSIGAYVCILLDILLYIFKIITYQVAAPVWIIVIGLKQFLNAYNSYKNNEEGLILFNIIMGTLCIIVVLCGVSIFYV